MKKKTNRKMRRSKVAAACLQNLAKKQKAAEMTEGYQALAEEHKQFARLASGVIPEVLPEWKCE